jgi:hypothetical protein
MITFAFAGESTSFRIKGNTFVGEGKIMKRYLWVFLFLASTCYAEVNQSGPYIVRSLQKQVENLTTENQQLKQQLADKDKEIERLKSLCRKNNINVSVGSAYTDSHEEPNTEHLNSQTTGPIIYRGQERTKEWFEKMYERFSDKIALAGDKFVDLRTFKPNEVSANFVEVGTILYTDGQNMVISVIGNGEAMIEYLWSYSSPGVLYHLCGYDRPLIDGQRLNIKNKLICVGTYKYTTVLKAQKTVQSFKIWQPKPLTRAQFAEAISSGFELVNYVERGGKTIETPIR